MPKPRRIQKFKLIEEPCDIYKSACYAAEVNGVDQGNISKACKSDGKIKVGGYIWRFVDD